MQDLFADESISDLGLEEVALDDASETWRVTVGFARPWEKANNSLIAAAAGLNLRPRTYKIISISDKSAQVISVMNRDVKI